MDEDLMEGARIELIRMKDELEDVMYSGLRGTFLGCDDVGHLQMQWDNGSTLSLIADVDKYKVLGIDEEEEE
jgi:hypothetical protein